MDTVSQATTNFLPLALPAVKLPNSEYHVRMIDAVRDGQFLRSRFRILRGPFAGQVVYLVTDFNDFKSRGLFTSWCIASGNHSPKETAELVVPVLVTVKQRMIDGVSVPMVVKFSRALEAGQ